MDITGMLNQPDRDVLKARLNVATCAEKLGIQLDRDGTGMCPFHEDSHPSFYLWDGDDGQQRWHCQPCGFGGDIFDLIRRTYGCSFPEALTRAQEILDSLPPGYEPPSRALAHSRPDPSEWYLDVAAAQQRAEQQPGILAALVGLASIEDAELCQRWDVYLRGTWGWGVTALGQVYMPHFSMSDGSIVGCKVRSADGSRASLPGSTYAALYGAWSGRRHPDVILTEGETDAAYAGWEAGRANLALDVYALPSGAQQDIDPRWLDFLKDYCRTIYLAFDPDTAGVDATRRWVEAFERDGRFDNIRVCCLPLGRDLRAARPDIRQLLAAARRPLPLPAGIHSSPGGYVKEAADGNPRIVTNWTIDPIAQLSGGDEPGYDVRLDNRGIQSSEVIRLAELANSASLKRWANKRGLTFTGTDADVQSITKLVEARGAITPEIFQSARVGLHSPPPAYEFAGPSVVLPRGYIGHMPWRYAPSGRTAANVDGRILLPLRDDAKGPFDWTWLSAYLALSEPAVTHPMLAWMVAAARRPEVQQFPLLFIGGSSGTGKSTLARLTIRLAGSQVEVDLGGTTKFVLTTTLASTTSIPIFIDEWTLMSGKEIRQAFKGMIPIIYTGGISERGQADLSTVPYFMTSPVVVAGEDTFVLTREQERMVPIQPSRAKQNPTALQHLLGKPIERFGSQLNQWLTGSPTLPPFDLTPPTRIEYNRSVLRTGWATLHAFLDDAEEHGEDVPSIPREPDLSCFEREASMRDTNVYDMALQEGLPLHDAQGLAFVWADPDGRGTWVRTQALIGELGRRQMDLELPGGGRAMLNYFREQYTVEEHQVRMAFPITKRIRAHLIYGLHLDTQTEEEHVEDSVG